MMMRKQISKSFLSDIFRNVSNTCACLSLWELEIVTWPWYLNSVLMEYLTRFITWSTEICFFLGGVGWGVLYKSRWECTKCISQDILLVGTCNPQPLPVSLQLTWMNSLSLAQMDADILLLSEHKLVTMCISWKTKWTFLHNSEYILKNGVLYLVASTCPCPVARFYFSMAIMIQKKFSKLQLLSFSNVFFVFCFYHFHVLAVLLSVCLQVTVVFSILLGILNRTFYLICFSIDKNLFDFSITECIL